MVFQGVREPIRSACKSAWSEADSCSENSDFSAAVAGVTPPNAVEKWQIFSENRYPLFRIML